MLENTEDRRQIKDTDNTQAEHIPDKAYNTKHSKMKLPRLVIFYDTRPGNEVGLYYNEPSWVITLTQWQTMVVNGWKTEVNNFSLLVKKIDSVVSNTDHNQQPTQKYLLSVHSNIKHSAEQDWTSTYLTHLQVFTSPYLLVEYHP